MPLFFYQRIELCLENILDTNNDMFGPFFASLASFEVKVFNQNCRKQVFSQPLRPHFLSCFFFEKADFKARDRREKWAEHIVVGM